MSSIADALGIQWGEPESNLYTLTNHARKQAREKGYTENDVHLAANQPHHTYPSGKYPGQMRHVRNGLVAIVDPSSRKVVTIYQNTVSTPLRPDQRRDSEAVLSDRRRNGL